MCFGDSIKNELGWWTYEPSIFWICDIYIGGSVNRFYTHINGIIFMVENIIQFKLPAQFLQCLYMSEIYSNILAPSGLSAVCDWVCNQCLT